VLENRASRTAEYMAAFRALETLHRPAEERLFEDRFAERFVGTVPRLLLKACRVPLIQRSVVARIDHAYPGARSAGVVRTRYIDDVVRDECAAGAEQVVILGAGFDCRAHRVRELLQRCVFELDHPATLAKKRRTMAAAPAKLEYVPIDFNREKLRDVLSAFGYVREARSLFIWEGVTNYLESAAVSATVAAIAELTPPPSQIVFTYVHRGLLDGSVRFEGTERLLATLRDRGEPWTFGFDPKELAAYLGSRGFELFDDVSVDELRHRYWGERALAFTGYEFYRVARARRI
jgi:methyltransferase (TIGR00027 family)